MDDMSASDYIALLNSSILPAPSHYTATHPSPRTIFLSWEQSPFISHQIQSYIIFIWLINGLLTTNYSLPTFVQFYHLRELQPYTQYQTAISAFTHDGNFTQFSPVITFRTNESSPFSYPSLSINSVYIDSISLSWSTLPVPYWRGSPYRYKLYWNQIGAPKQYKLFPDDVTAYTLTSLFPGADYSVCISALTEFGGEGPSSPCSMATTPSILSSPLQYTAILPILVLSLCLAGVCLLIRRLVCSYEGLSASLFKKQRKRYELYASNYNGDQRQSPRLMGNSKVTHYSPKSPHNSIHSCNISEIKPVESPQPVKSEVTLPSDGSYSQLPTPLRPLSALNAISPTHSNKIRAPQTSHPDRVRQHMFSHVATTYANLPLREHSSQTPLFPEKTADSTKDVSLEYNC